MLKFILPLFLSFNLFADCSLQLQGVLDDKTVNLLEDLQMPNCTRGTSNIDFMCNCAKDYQTFKEKESVKVLASFKLDANREREKLLVQGAKATVVSMMYDLNYADNILNISEDEKKIITQENQCNLDFLKEEIQQSCGNNPLLQNINLDKMITELQNEGLHISSNESNLKEKGFFDRDKNSCNISDNYLLTLQNYKSLYSLRAAKGKLLERTFQDNPLGYYLANIDKKAKLPKFKSMSDLKTFLTENKNDFVTAFSQKCKDNFKNVAKVFCSDLSNSKISDADFRKSAEISHVDYDEDEFLDYQEKISNFCITRNDGIDKFSPLKNLLQYGIEKEKIDQKEEKKLRQKERQDFFKIADTMADGFPKDGYDRMFKATCGVLQENRPISLDKLKELDCNLKDFAKNFKNSSRENDKKANCPLLVLDYILNTSEEELTKQKVDKELIAFKKESSEKSTSESKGSGLLTSFLSISKPETVAKFKAAGIDAKPTDNGSQTASNNSNAKASSSSNNAPQRNAMNVQQPTSNRVVQNAQASSQGQAESYAPQYNQLFPNLAPSEREQIQDIEKEIMRRLGTNNEKSQVERQRAEMYKNYSKELEDLAKERKRLESGSKNSADVANYDKKMQDLIDQMKSENQKIARGQGNQNEVIQAGASNNDKGQNFGAPTRTASNANPFGTPSAPTQNSIMNDATNKALNETVNRERFNELTGKKDNTTANRSPAALETVNQKFALIENGRVIEISSMDELINQKRSMNEPFVIAFKDSPTMRVEIVPTKQGYTFKPLGNLQNKEYRSFFMEVKMTLENEKQNFHREELQEKLGKIKN